jgi:hypothetical protein
MQQFDRHVLSAIDPAAIQRAFDPDVQRERLYHSLPLFLTFFNQTLHGCSCRDAVSHGTLRQWLPPRTCPRNAAYCNARLRMSASALQTLVRNLGRRLAGAPARSPCQRPIRVVDGSSVTLSDTPTNRAAYPQSSQQRPHCGFPLLYFVALMDLASGALLDLATGNQTDSERGLFRRLWNGLAAGDIVLGDRGFDGFADTALLQQRGIDTIFRLHQSRQLDLQCARKNGAGDWSLELPAPVPPPAWAAAESLPASLRVRIVEFKAPRCCRNQGRIRLITTLLDTVLYPKAWLVAVYRRRWEMELNLRHIKSTLGLDELAGRSPAMCRKELLMGLLVYNLVRWLMLAAASAEQVALARISFKGSWTRCILWLLAPIQDRARLFKILKKQLASDLVPDRPNRREPRCIKRRPKAFPQLWGSRRAVIAWERRKRTG